MRHKRESYSAYPWRVPAGAEPRMVTMSLQIKCMVTATVSMAFHSTLQSQTALKCTYSLDCRPFGFFLSLFLL